MSIFFEILIIVAASLLCIGFDLIVSIRVREEHFYIRSAEALIKCYELRKMKFLFASVFVINRNWKYGLIKKESLWEMVGFYLYYLLLIIASVVYYSITKLNFVLEYPIIFILLVAVIPLLATLIILIMKNVFTYAKKTQLNKE